VPFFGGWRLWMACFHKPENVRSRHEGSLPLNPES
jgi:hypothetical protein